MPNPNGRWGAPMQKAPKAALSAEIDILEAALLDSEIRRREAEQKLKEIEAILKRPIAEIGPKQAEEMIWEAKAAAKQGCSH